MVGKNHKQNTEHRRPKHAVLTYWWSLATECADFCFNRFRVLETSLNQVEFALSTLERTMESWSLLLICSTRIECWLIAQMERCLESFTHSGDSLSLRSRSRVSWEEPVLELSRKLPQLRMLLPLSRRPQLLSKWPNMPREKISLTSRDSKWWFWESKEATEPLILTPR